MKPAFHLVTASILLCALAVACNRGDSHNASSGGGAATALGQGLRDAAVLTFRVDGMRRVNGAL